MNLKLIVLLSISLSIGGCEEAKNNSTLEITKNDKEIQVTLNRNIEAIGIVLNLSDMGQFILDNHPEKNYTLIKYYRKEFDAFKLHPAVIQANKLGKLNLLHFGYYYYGLSFSELPEFKPTNTGVNEYHQSETLTTEQIDKELNQFNQLIIDFYIEAKLEDFFEENEAFYNAILSEIRKTLPNKIISTMEDFFGEHGSEYVICPSPTIFTGFNFGPTLSTDTSKVFYYLTGPGYDLKKESSELVLRSLKDSLGFNDKEYIVELAIHEFGHSFVRFLDKNKDLIDSLSYLNTDQLKNNLEKIGEGTAWSTGFEEHLVRACEIMVWRNLGHPQIADEKLNFEKNEEGLLYIQEFVTSLEVYEDNRDQYPTLESYIAVLTEDLSALKVPNHSKGN